MKIVHLENAASNFDGIDDLSRWKALGEYTSYDRTPQDEVIARSRDAEIVLCNKSRFSEAEFSALPRLRYIGVFATGYNVIDLEAAHRHSVTVTNVPAYSTDSVAELTFAHLLNLAKGVETHAQSDWTKSPDFTHVVSPQFELAGKTLGIVGFGAIGRKVALLAAAFGMKVLVHTRTPAKVNVPGVKAVPFAELLKHSDVVTLHCPQTKENFRMMNEEAFAQMKAGAFFINTARGTLVDETALAHALQSGHLAGAGLDVLSEEPPRSGQILLSIPNCRISHHIAWATCEARKRLLDTAFENLKSFLNGNVQNAVSF